MSNLKQVLKNKVEMLEEIQNYKDQIRELVKKVKNLDKVIYKICEHEWELDSSCSDDDLGKKYCLICGLRNYYMYK